MQKLLEAARNEWAEKAKTAFQDSMLQARKAWTAQNFDECEEHLEAAAGFNPNCEVVHRFRSALRSRSGKLDDALADASNAVASFPGNPRNHHTLAIATQRKQMLGEAGAAYLTSMSRGMPGTSDELGFTQYLNTVRRERRYFGDMRPAHRKAVNGSLCLARSPSRSTIFDPEKTLDEEAAAGEDIELPDPPQIHLVSADTNSVTVAWEPATGHGTGGITIYGYELQAAAHDVIWEGTRFFDGYRTFQRVHKADSGITSTTVEGLRTDNKVMLRIRAQSYSGFGDWNEIVVSTLPPPSKQVESLPLPRKWLQVDVADMVPNHVMEVGGEPKRFFLELANCFTPNVRKIRRLFFGWSRAGLVGQKTRPGEVSRQQFLRFCKEVGLCAGGGAMCTRSGAKLLSANEVDRIFQRVNIDTRELGNTRGGMAQNALMLDHSSVARLADNALEDLHTHGRVEADPGETELREKLKPLFDQYDEDGSGSVSTDEVGKMAAGLKMEITKEQLEELMFQADPDGKL